jgi:hypothetical protein
VLHLQFRLDASTAVPNVSVARLLGIFGSLPLYTGRRGARLEAGGAKEQLVSESACKSSSRPKSVYGAQPSRASLPNDFRCDTDTPCIVIMSDPDERWIECESMKHDEEEEGDGLDCLFQDPDPYDTFDFQYQHQGKTIDVQLKGHKQELGQTLNSTGLTLWRASNILCDFMVEHASDYIQNKTILEVSL